MERKLRIVAYILLGGLCVGVLLASLGGTMRRRGASLPAITMALRAENREKCEPPLPDGEVDAIARSVARYEPASTALASPHAGSRADDDNEPPLLIRSWPCPLDLRRFMAWPAISSKLSSLIPNRTRMPC